MDRVNAEALELRAERSVARMERRAKLQKMLDEHMPGIGEAVADTQLDTYAREALSLVLLGKARAAIDLGSEPDDLRDRYGRGSAKKVGDGSHRLLDDFLMARRLVEAGARCVTLAFSRWDWHGGNFKRARQDMPMLDQALTALVEDLHQRGMNKDVSVVVWGEFGRTPKVNNKAGRDHWPKLSTAVLACGQMNHGQVIGASDKHAGEAIDRPVRFVDMEGSHSIVTEPATVRAEYQSQLKRFLDKLRDDCHEFNADYRRVTLDQSYGQVLADFLTERAQHATRA